MVKLTIDSTYMDFIPEIYDAIVDPEKWPIILDKFASFCSAGGASFVLVDRVNPEILSRAVTSNFDPVFVREYEKKFQEEEAQAFKRVSQFPVQTWVSEETAFDTPAEVNPANAFLMAHTGLNRRSALKLNNTPIWLDGLTINFKKGRDNISAEEEAISRFFLPHIAKAAELSRPFLLLRTRYQAVLGMLDKLQIGTAIVRRSGEIVLKNEKADRYLSKDDGIYEGADKHLMCGQPKFQGQLAEAIEKAMQPQHHLASSTAVTVPKKSQGLPWILEVSPLNTVANSFDDNLPFVTVVIIDPEDRHQVSTDNFQSLFDLTDAEQHVAALIVNGHKVDEIAEIRNTTISTAKSQVKSVYQKTETGSQSALVRLALKVNIPLEKDD